MVVTIYGGDFTNIKKYVRHLVNKYHTSNPYELADCLHVKILSEELGHIRGFYQSCPKNKVIHINKNLDEANKLFVCGHELGHAMLHPKLNIVFIEHNTCLIKNKYENQANKFAAELLIPDNIKNKYENLTFEQIAAAENVNVELLKLKFN